MLNRLNLAAWYDLTLSDSNFPNSRHGCPNDRGNDEARNDN